MISRRGLLAGILAAAAAPAIIHAGSLMPVKAFKLSAEDYALDAAAYARYLHKLANPPMLENRFESGLITFGVPGNGCINPGDTVTLNGSVYWLNLTGSTLYNVELAS